MSVTFETKVWQKDWAIVLKTNRLAEIVKRIDCPLIENRVLFINNVEHPAAVARVADRHVATDTIDEYVFVDEHASKALDFFGLTKASLGIGYYYSIAELVSIYLCRTEYLLHFAGDTAPLGNVLPGWLGRGVDVLRKRPDVVAYNLSWDATFEQPADESDSADDDFFYGYGFSDQMYLVRTADFRAPIYCETNPASYRYPKYGGELFEKRVDSWMRNHSKLRATDRRSAYRHKNFPSKPWGRLAAVAFGDDRLD